MTDNNLREFRLTLGAFTEETVPERIRDFRDAVSLEALRGVVLLTPVDEGRLRGNWQLTLVAPAEGHDPDRLDGNGEETIAAGAEALSVARSAGGNPFSIVWLHNGVPYGVYVNDGVAPYTTKAGNPHPGQPAVHMVEQTVERLQRAYG